MLQTDLQAKLTQARKSGDKEALSLLSVILGDLSTLKARNNKEATEDQIENLIRGLRDKNNETVDLLTGVDIDKQLVELSHDLQANQSRIAELQAAKQQRVQGRIGDLWKLRKENDYLTSLLPTTLTVEEIKVALAEIQDQLMAAKGGAAVGLAMKFLKPKGLKVLGDDVKIAVEQLKQ